MKNLIIVGSGAVAAELTSYIENQNSQVGAELFNILGYLDEDENIAKYWARYKLKMPVLANVSTYVVRKDDHFIIGISSLSFRQKKADEILAKGGKVINFIHHTSIIAASAKIGSGNIIYPHCIIGPNAVMGDNNVLTSYSYISHDCQIGDNNFFSTSGLAGHVKIGSNNYFGIRASVIPKVTIGNENVVQAGMIVDKDLGDGAVVFYRFKEKVIAVDKSQR